jgi:tRNA (guanine37-N1)-methyltransferase
MRLKERMRGVIPEDQIGHLSNRFQIIGDVAIISLPPKMKTYEKEVARIILSGNKGLRTVLNKVSQTHGDKRVVDFDLIAGNGTVTMHKEFGFRYRLDVRRVFFNSHLGYERRRIASKARFGENILIPFCGVGPFVVPVAAKGARVLAIESNSDACGWLAENVRLNRVEDNVDLIKADAFRAADMLDRKKQRFDRAIIPTPYGIDHVLGMLSPLVKIGGVIHFYTFKKKHQIPGLIKEYEDSGYVAEFFRRCGNVAPGVSRWVFDLVKC